MSALSEAQEKLDYAQQAHAAAQLASNTASAKAAALRAQVASGEATAVSATDIAAADDEAAHALLVVQGATNALAGLDDVVREAWSNALCDQIASTLPILGRHVLDALAEVEAALAELTSTAQAYDAFTANATMTINVGSLTSSRVNNDRFRGISVDRLPLIPSHSERLLATVLVPVLVALGAPAYFVTEVRTIAAAASPPVTN